MKGRKRTHCQDSKDDARNHILGDLSTVYTPESQAYQTVARALRKLSRAEIWALAAMVSTARR